MATGIIKGRTQTLVTSPIQYNTNASYCIKKDGIVSIRLRIDPKNDVNRGTILLTIPEEYRPRYPFNILGYQSPDVVVLELSDNGNLTVISDLRANVWCSATITYVQ